ncbi:MAG: polyhydroxyalkanoate synthesis regulator DNA-binding domain-containing protein [Candidatus Methylomirabilis sp.]
MASEPILIKRYENRKLYDSSRSTYVTLEEIARMIREGKEVRVVDARTHEDLTKNTLALIILEGERQKKNLLPLSFMYQLIKYGESIQGVFQEYLSSGFEAFLASQQQTQKRLREWADGRLGKDPSGEQPNVEFARDASLKDEVDQLKRKLEELERRVKTERE